MKWIYSSSDEAERIYKKAKELDSPFGFWGSPNLRDNENKKELIERFVTFLKKKGYHPRSIVLFGTWNTGRFIADRIHDNMTPDEFEEVLEEFDLPSEEEVLSRSNEDHKKIVEDFE